MGTLAFVIVGVLAASDSTGHEGRHVDATADLREGQLHSSEHTMQLQTWGDQQSPEYLQMLAKRYLLDGRLQEAFGTLQSVAEHQGTPDAETLKELATIGQWMRRYTAAGAWLHRAEQVAPDDPDVRDAMTRLNLQRSVHVFGSVGGWEPDYVTSARSMGVFVGWLDWLDVYGGYSTEDHTFYRRANFWADAYLFLSYQISLRIGIRRTQYMYPFSGQSVDQSAYSELPSFQAEAAYAYGDGNSFSLEGEYFRPNFFQNNSLHANNFKVSVNAQHWLIRPMYAAVFASYLRDPDDATLQSSPLTDQVQTFSYEGRGLFGGALGVDNNHLTAEVKFIPDRDLDRSILWSFFGKFRYSFGDYALQYDLLYDRYASAISRGFSASRVHQLSLLASLMPALDVRIGAKALSRETTQFAPFVYLRVKTGL